MNQGTQGYSLTKKTEGRKSRDTVSLNLSAPPSSLPHTSLSQAFSWPVLFGVVGGGGGGGGGGVVLAAYMYRHTVPNIGKNCHKNSELIYNDFTQNLETFKRTLTFQCPALNLLYCSGTKSLLCNVMVPYKLLSKQ
jgi:hypothetical protein